MQISVVLSFYNEEAVIPELVRRLRTALDTVCPGDYELVFVNDASTDRSLEILKALAVGHNDIRVVNMSRNFGVSVCVMAGLRHTSGDAVVYMDADLQDPPELLPTMIESWRTGKDVDVVYTTRRKRAGENPVKMWFTIIGYKILKATSDIELVPNSGDFKLLSRRVVNELVKLHEHKPFVRGLVVWAGFKQVQVLYDREARFSGKTKFPIYSRKVIYNFIDSALISFSDTPLKLALAAGFVVSASAFAYLVYIVIKQLLGFDLPGWSTIMATMLALGGMQLLTIGALGLYINAIYRECRHRPTYIVKDTFGYNTQG